MRLCTGPPLGSWIGIVVPAQSTNSFSPALCSWRSTTSCLRRQRWYSSQKRAVAIAVRVGLPVLLPQQLLGHVLVSLQLFVNVRKVRKVACRGTRWLRIGGEQGGFQLRFGHLLRKRPRQTRRREPTQIFVYRTLAQIRTTGDLTCPSFSSNRKLRTRLIFAWTLCLQALPPPPEKARYMPFCPAPPRTFPELFRAFLSPPAKPIAVRLQRKSDRLPAEH